MCKIKVVKYKIKKIVKTEKIVLLLRIFECSILFL
jgi:hypothetical protein